MVLLVITLAGNIAFASRKRKILAEQHQSELLYVKSNELENALNEVAKEVHDQTVPRMVVLKQQVISLMAPLVREEGRKEQLHDLDNEFSNLVMDIQLMSHHLSGKVLDGQNFEDNISEMVRKYDSLKQFHCEVAFLGEPTTFDKETSRNLHRIIQECLHNTLKHAAATTVSVIIDYREEYTLITVSDDGRGYDLSSVAGKRSMGRLNLKERTDQLGGTLDVKSKSGEGTSITIQIPVK